MSLEPFHDFDKSAQEASRAMYANLETSQDKSEFAAKLGELQLRYESEYYPKEQEVWQDFGELFEPDCTDVLIPGRVSPTENVRARQWFVTAQDDIPLAARIECAAPYKGYLRKSPARMFKQRYHTRLVEETVKARQYVAVDFYNILPGPTGQRSEQVTKDGNYLTPVVGASVTTFKPEFKKQFAENTARDAMRDEIDLLQYTERSKGMASIVNNLGKNLKLANIRINPLKWLAVEAEDDKKDDVLSTIESTLESMNTRLERARMVQEMLRGAKPEDRGYVLGYPHDTV